MLKYHSCGEPIWENRIWNGKAWINVYLGRGGLPAERCPRCTRLIMEDDLSPVWLDDFSDLIKCEREGIIYDLGYDSGWNAGYRLGVEDGKRKR